MHHAGRRARRTVRQALGAVAISAVSALAVAAPAGATSTADLSVTKVDAKDPVVVGEEVEYRIRVRNSGPSSARDVVVKDALPASFTVTSVPSGCSRSGRTVRCHAGTLRSGQRVSGSLRGRFTATGRFRNSVTVSSSTRDPRSSNDGASASTTVNPPAQRPTDLTIDKQGPAIAVAGRPVTFTIKVSNVGPNRASRVLLEDTLPTNFDVSSTSIPCDRLTPFVLNCSFGTVDVGETEVLLITGAFRADPVNNPMGSVNTAKVFIDLDGDLDPDPTNNTDSTTTVVAGAPVGTF